MTSSSGLHDAVDYESLVFPKLSESEIGQLLARSASLAVTCVHSVLSGIV